jgi:tetratricopeptide (TPR) repeat protein
LTAAFHLYICYRDYQKARLHIAIAKQALPNSADALALGGYLDRRQGRWAESTNALERAINLDPKNPEILNQLVGSYQYLRQYRDSEKIYDRLIALEPEEPGLNVQKAALSLDEKGELAGQRAALEALPSSMGATNLKIADMALSLVMVIGSGIWPDKRPSRITYDLQSESFRVSCCFCSAGVPTLLRKLRN